MTNAAPRGYHSVTPYLTLADPERAIDFYRRALGATELYRVTMPDGKLGHAELQIGDSRIMCAEENPDWGNRSPRTLGGSPITLCLYTTDVDALGQRFANAGGKLLRPITNQSYGDRSGQFEDPEGYRWTLAQRIEALTPEEMIRRSAGAGTP